MQMTDTTGSLWRIWLVVGALGLSAGCASEDLRAFTCHGNLHAAFDISPSAAVYEDTTLPGVEGWVIDPAPMLRGEHPVERWWWETSTCEWVGGWYAWAPPPPPGAGGHAPDDTSADHRPQFRATTGDATIRALIVIGEDPGATEDAASWERAATSLGGASAILRAPSREVLWDAVAMTCLGASAQDTVLLAATGRGSPASGGSLVLGPEAVSYAALFEHVAQACQTAGLIVAVMDSSYTTAQGATWPGDAPPLVTWHGSDEAAPDAPRRRPGGGGLLSGALTAHIESLAKRDCLASGHATPREMAHLFGDEQAVVLRMKQLQWAESDRAAVQDVATRALPALPAQVVHAIGAVPSDSGCVDDAGCASRAAGCALPSCQRLACIDGRCTGTADEGAPCDDQSVCTFGDRCDSQGLCRGVLVDCEDNAPCTIDTCLHDEGCVHTPQPGAACDDGDLCTTQDTCTDAGLCVGSPIDCGDDNPCTFDWCDPNDGCVFEASHASCDDGSACTSPDYCEDGLCRGVPLACHDQDPCTVDACDLEKGCVNPAMPEGALCNDENGCTQDDRCTQGECVGTDANCDDGWACTLDACDNGTCSHLPEPGTCLDESGCIPIGAHPAQRPCEICVATNLLEPDPLSEGDACPDDGVPCTADLCQAGVCTHPNEPGTCHGPDGVCVSVGEPITECLTCVDTGVAEPMPLGTLCDDGQSCTVGDSCDDAGVCTSASVPCCPVVTGLACGGLIEGTTVDGVGSAAVSDWSCLPVPYPAAERAHHFRAPCDGEVIFQLNGQPGQLLFLIRGPPSNDEAPSTQCLSGECDTYSSSGLTQWMFIDQEFMLVVDGLAGVEGPYSIEVLCDCPGPAP